MMKNLAVLSFLEVQCSHDRVFISMGFFDEYSHVLNTDEGMIESFQSSIIMLAQLDI